MDSSKVSWSDYRAWDDDNRWEVIDGHPYAMTGPRVSHQRVCGEIFGELRSHFKDRPCEPFLSPIDVKLSEHDIVQPDLIVVCDQSKIKRWEGGVSPFSHTTRYPDGGGQIRLGTDFAANLGELGPPGKELTERQLEVAFHETLHLTGAGHSDRKFSETWGHIPEEAFMIHVTRVCLKTSGQHAAYVNHREAYPGSNLYWSGDYRGYPDLETLIWKFSIK